MAPNKFPTLIHVSYEEAENNDEPWLQVHTDGVHSIEEPGKSVAIYKLVEVGKAQIQKSFVAKKRR